MKISVIQNQPGALSFALPEKAKAYCLLFLLSILLTVTAMAQSNIVIKGRVTNEKNQPVVGASVLVKGTANGTVTDEAGDYTISAPSDGVLIISSVGYPSKEIVINNQATHNLSLTTASTDLEHVVVVGYGTLRKKDVTGATVNVTEKALREVPVANLQQALMGRAAGLEVQQISNNPGAGAMIRIRGTRSISGSNEPLYVVDNIPFDGNLSDINPDDVVSVDVLKDASATAIYGSRGANGVILVTTRKGRTGESRISYNGYYGVGTPAYKYPVFNASEYQSMRNLSSWAVGYLPEEQKGIAAGRNTDWQDLMYDNSMRTDHNISILGGKDGNTFSLGAGYYKETTLMPGEDYTRGTLRATIDSRVGKRLKVGLSTMNSLSYARGQQFVAGSAMFRMLAASPLMPAHDSTGKVYLLPNSNVDDNNAGVYNPLLLKGNETWDDRVRRVRTFNNLYAEYEFIKGLRYRMNAGLNFAQEFGGQFRGQDQLPNNPSFFRPMQGNLARVSNGETWGYTLENLLFYDKTVKDHKFNFTGLYSIQESQSSSNFIQKDSITEDFVSFYNLALSTAVNSSNTTMGGSESRWALISYMARLNYAFRDRYLLTLTYRRDGSSRLAPGNQWFDYPAISAGWVISDESFMSDVKLISALKLRAGWGKTSNQALNPYESKGLVNNSNGLPAGNTGGNISRYNFGPTVVTGYNVVTLPNPDLSWEFTSTTNIGLDFGLWNNRLTGTFEWYKSTTNDILYSVSLPVTSGVAGGFLTNIGEMSNKGFELTLSGDIYRSKPGGFTWSADLNLFKNKNTLEKISDNVEQDIGSQLFVGHSMTAIYDYKRLGVWQLNEAAQAAAVGSAVGQIKLVDYSGPNGKPDGVINATYDRYVIGDMDADLQGGMTNRFTYKGFDLSAVMTARFGGTLVSSIHQPLASYISILDGRRNTIKVDYWTPTNPSNWFPVPQGTTSGDFWRTLGYYDASYIRLRSVNIGYSLNGKWLKQVHAQNLHVYFTVDNVAILYSPYYDQTGIDPQATAAGDRGVGSVLSNLRTNDRSNGALVIGLGTPPRRTFTFGLNLSL